MTIQVKDYEQSVTERAKTLSLPEPTGISILPRNFFTASSASELVHEDSALTLKSLLRQAHLEFTTFESPEKPFLRAHENHFGWEAPIRFVSYAYLSGNPEALSVALGVLSNYLTDWLKGLTKSKDVKLSIVVETEYGKRKEVTYSGPVEGLKDLDSVVKETFRS